MRAITVTPPWAYAITDMGKIIENRSQRPPYKLIGERIAIHASIGFDDSAADWMFQRGVMRPVHMKAEAAARFDARGAVIGTAVLIGFTTGDREVQGTFTDTERFMGRDRLSADDLRWHMVGKIGHVFADVRALGTPVAARGQLGYWRLPGEAAAKVLAQ